MGPIQTIDDFVDFLRRRWLLMAAVVVLGCLASVYVALAQRHLYASTEILQVVQPRIDQDLADTTVVGSVARRLQVVEQVLMSRRNVLATIDELNLYSELAALTENERVVLFREAVEIRAHAAAGTVGSDDGSVAVLTFTAEMPTPVQAQQVAHHLAQQTIDLSFEARLSQASETLEFFRAEEVKLGEQVAELENLIADFRYDNRISVPGDLEFRRSQIAALNEALLTIDREMLGVQLQIRQIDPTTREATRQRLTEDFQAELDGLADQRKLLTERRDELTAEIETAPEIERELGVYERRLEQLQNQLSVVTARRSEAEVGFKLESERRSESLIVLEEARIPDYPSTPSRKRNAILGAGISVVLAFLLGFGLELMNPVIRSGAQMKREMGIEPVVSIPHLDAKASARRQRKARRRLTRKSG